MTNRSPRIVGRPRGAKVCRHGRNNVSNGHSPEGAKVCSQGRNNVSNGHSPEGAKVCSQGRKPLVAEALYRQAPEGRQNTHARDASVAPPGLDGILSTSPRGSRPGLQTTAPAELRRRRPSRPLRRRLAWASCLAAVLTIALAGCSRKNAAEKQRGAGPRIASTQPASRQGPLKIAVIPKATNHEYWKSIRAGAIKAERELPGVQILWKGPAKEDDREQQINVIENFISAGVDGIVIAPLDDTALIRPVLDAKRSGIPVVVMDSGLKAEAGRDFVSYVATDNFGGGQKAGRLLGRLLDGKGKVIVMRYLVGSASTSQREDGCLDVLAREFPEIEVVSSDQYAGPTTDTAYAKAQNLLSRFGQIDGVFCALEPSAFGMLRALQDAGKAGKVKLVGFDTSLKLIEAMEAGQLHGLVLQDPLNMGYTAVKSLVAHIRGQNVPPRTDTGSTVVTPENMDEPRIKELLAPPIDRYLP
jgi:ribose transport system substrate-binding protein